MPRMTLEQMEAEFASKFEKFSQDAERIFQRLGWTWQGEIPTASRIETICWHCRHILLVEPNKHYHQCGTGGIMLDYVNWPQPFGGVSTECRLYIQVHPGALPDPLPLALDTAPTVEAAIKQMYEAAGVLAELGQDFAVEPLRAQAAKLEKLLPQKL